MDHYELEYSRFLGRASNWPWNSGRRVPRIQVFRTWGRPPRLSSEVFLPLISQTYQLLQQSVGLLRISHWKKIVRPILQIM